MPLLLHALRHCDRARKRTLTQHLGLSVGVAFMRDKIAGSTSRSSRCADRNVRGSQHEGSRRFLSSTGFSWSRVSKYFRVRINRYEGNTIAYTDRMATEIMAATKCGPLQHVTLRSDTKRTSMTPRWVTSRQISNSAHRRVTGAKVNRYSCITPRCK